MSDLLTQLRLKWFFAAKTLKYTSDYLDRSYQIFLNHHKVLHFRRGHPVYSLSTPALYSKPAANFFAQQFYKIIRNKSTPNLMSFAVTDVCNATCGHCSFYDYDDVGRRKKTVLTLPQAQKVLKDAQALGVSVINFTGGEPLLREDFPEIVRSVDKDLSTTILFTHGGFLADRVGELKKAGLDSIYISLDFADPAKHDAHRGIPGLFRKAVDGIIKARATGFSTGISCCLTPESFRDGEFQRIVELGKQIGVHEVLFLDAMPTGRLKQRKDLIGNTVWLDDMIEAAKVYNADTAYPGVLVYAYAMSYRGVGCSCGTDYFYVSPYGDICPCDWDHVIFGNILETPLHEIWDQMNSRDDFKSVKCGLCKIKDPAWQDKKTISGEFCRYDESSTEHRSTCPPVPETLGQAGRLER